MMRCGQWVFDCVKRKSTSFAVSLRMSCEFFFLALMLFPRFCCSFIFLFVSAVDDVVCVRVSFCKESFGRTRMILQLLRMSQWIQT